MMNEYKNLSKPIEETFTNFYGCWFLVNKANVLFGYEVITMIIVLVTTKANHWILILTKSLCNF